MKRVFYPVGQGAFYIEKIHGANIVYDCGSITKNSNIDHCIKHAFKNGEVIEAIFISHFDRDHINRLKDILAWCEVRHIFCH